MATWFYLFEPFHLCHFQAIDWDTPPFTGKVCDKYAIFAYEYLPWSVVSEVKRLFQRVITKKNMGACVQR